jgi:hypothetical protein
MKPLAFAADAEGLGLCHLYIRHPPKRTSEAERIVQLIRKVAATRRDDARPAAAATRSPEQRWHTRIRLRPSPFPSLRPGGHCAVKFTCPKAAQGLPLICSRFESAVLQLERPGAVNSLRSGEPHDNAGPSDRLLHLSWRANNLLEDFARSSANTIGHQLRQIAPGQGSLRWAIAVLRRKEMTRGRSARRIFTPGELARRVGESIAG